MVIALSHGVKHTAMDSTVKEQIASHGQEGGQASQLHALCVGNNTKMQHSSSASGQILGMHAPRHTTIHEGKHWFPLTNLQFTHAGDPTEDTQHTRHKF